MGGDMNMREMDTELESKAVQRHNANDWQPPQRTPLVKCVQMRAASGLTGDSLLESLQMKSADAEVRMHEDVHALAHHGVQGTCQKLPHLTQIQASFGRHDISGISAFVGGRAAEASVA